MSVDSQTVSVRPLPVSLLAGGLLFLLTFPVFAILCRIEPGIQSNDHSPHLVLAQQMLRRELFPAHPLYQIAVLVAACCQSEWSVLTWAAAFVLALAVGVRGGLTAQILTNDDQPRRGVVVAVCIALALAAPLPNWWGDRIFGGQISPNVWHNPTAIFALPFCLFTFVWGLRAITSGTARDVRVCGFMLALSALAKPNFLMAFGPVFGVWLVVNCLYRGGINAKSAFRVVLLLIEAFWLPITILILQYALFFGSGGLSGKSEIIIAPFAVWRHSSPNIPASLLLSIAFPIIALAFFPRDAARNTGLLLSWAIFGVALLQWILLAESGDRLTHGNFGWGALLANHLLFVMTARFLLRQTGSRRKQVCFVVLGLHALTGMQLLRLCLENPEIANLH